jgi:hypothetical protein
VALSPLCRSSEHVQCRLQGMAFGPKDHFDGDGGEGGIPRSHLAYTRSKRPKEPFMRFWGPLGPHIKIPTRVLEFPDLTLKVGVHIPPTSRKFGIGGSLRRRVVYGPNNGRDVGLNPRRPGRSESSPPVFPPLRGQRFFDNRELRRIYVRRGRRQVLKYASWS